MKTTKTKRGFTLIELSLATVFLAVLLLMIATITINVSAIYQKGLSLRNVNATGRTLIDDFDRAIADAPLIRFTTSQDNYFRTRTGQAMVKRTNSSGKEERSQIDVQYSGAFCSGRYSYVWNTGYILNSESYETTADPLKLKYKINDQSIEKDDIRLIKFADSSRAACQNWKEGSSTLDISSSSTPLTDEPEELLSVADTQIELALYELNVFPATQDSVSLRSFYSGTFILATLTGDVNIKSEGDYCNPADDQSLAGDFNYCAVNKFNFAAQASGKK